MQPDSGQKPKSENSLDTQYFSSQDLTEAKKRYEQAKSQKKAKNRLTPSSIFIPLLLAVGVCLISSIINMASNVGLLIGILIFGLTSMVVAIILLARKNKKNKQGSINAKIIAKDIFRDFLITISFNVFATCLAVLGAIHDAFCFNYCTNPQGVMIFLYAFLIALGAEIVLLRSIKLVDRSIHPIDIIWLPVITIALFLIMLFFTYSN